MPVSPTVIANNPHLKLGKDGRWRVKESKKKPKSKSLPKIPVSKPEGLQFIINYLILMGVEYVPEYRFDEVRKFRFDVALPQYKLAIEYEGLNYGGKGGHQTVEGYTSNTEKYNKAASLGWTVYRYTHLNYKNFTNDLKDIMK